MERVIAVARGEVGYIEKASNSHLDDKTANPGSNNFTKYFRDLDQTGLYNGPKNGFAWCDGFVDWDFMTAYDFDTMVAMTYQELGGLGAGCTYSMNYYRAAGAFYDYPEVGDQCFFSSDGWVTSYHTGLVVGVSNGMIYTIEGNTSGEPGVVANGGMVAEKSYPISWAKYGRPNYSLVEGKTFGKEGENMTGKEIYDKLNEYLMGKPAPDWAQKELEEAKKMGITDGENMCALTPRYQAAIMAKRAVEADRRGGKLF